MNRSSITPKNQFLQTFLAALAFATSGVASYAQDGKSAEKQTGPAAPGAIAPTKRDIPKGELQLEETMVKTVIFFLDDISPTLIDDNPFGKDPFNLPRQVLSPALAEVTATVKKTPG